MYILNKENLAEINFAEIKIDESDDEIETKLINYYLKQRQLILNYFSDLNLY